METTELLLEIKDMMITMGAMNFITWIGLGAIFMLILIKD